MKRSAGASPCTREEHEMSKVNLYIAEVKKLEDPALYAAAFARMPKERQEKTARLRMQADRLRSVGAWMLLEQGMSLHGIGREELILSYGPYGKPDLADRISGGADHKADRSPDRPLPTGDALLQSRTDVHFNLSHAGKFVLLAVSDRPVGCDVEEIRPINDALARRFLTDGEQMLLQTAFADEIVSCEVFREAREEQSAECLPEAERLIRIWTRKESVLKMTGLGMRLDLRDLVVWPEFDAEADAPRSELTKEELAFWRTHLPDWKRTYRFSDFAVGNCRAACFGAAQAERLNFLELF